MTNRARIPAALVALILLAAACGGDGLTEQQRDEFLEGCTPAAGEAFCECALEQVEETFTSREFADMGASFPDDRGEAPAELESAIAPCLPLLSG
jgi:hypothetical protein